MSNPFDQFSSELHAALPPGAPPGQPPAPTNEAPLPAAPKPVMNGGPVGGYGAPPAFGGQPPQATPPYGMNPQPSYGMYGQGGAPAAPLQPPGAPTPPGGPFAAYGGAAPPPPPPSTPGTPGQRSYGHPATESQVGSIDTAPAANPFGAPTPAPQDLPQQSQPPAAGPFADPWGAPPPIQPQQQQPPMQQQQQLAPPGAHPQQQPHPPQPQPPFGSPGGPYTAAPGSQQQPDATGALVPAAQPPPQQPQPSDASLGALVPSAQQANPYAMNMYGQPPPPQQNPYGQPVPPYGQYDQHQQFQQPPPPPAVDPFSVFEASAAPPPAPVPPPQPTAAPAGPDPSASDDDFWGSFSANAAPAPAPVAPPPSDAVSTKSQASEEKKNSEDGLPPGGEWYDARIFTPTLGVMFFKPQELTDSLFLNTDRSLVDALGERPTVAFIVEGSSARSAGVELGHVLLKVNGVDVRNPKDASRLIKEGPRPLPLLFYVPNTDVVVAEGEHMVKYDTRDTTAPNSAKDWKPKYVVIGGIIAQPWMMNMYRSKSEYDIAVIETQARRPVSVKVKQFSLQGARIQNDWQGPQMVKYKNKLHPWKYIVVLPIARNPIKISAPNLANLKPVHEGIRRVLMAQQRDRGYNSNSAGPARDPYRGNYGGPPPGPPQSNYGPPPQQQQRGYDDHQGGGYSGPPQSHGGGGGGPNYQQQQLQQHSQPQQYRY